MDVNDLEENTVYFNYNRNCPIIIWFWEILKSYNKTEVAGFLQFVTGSCQVPHGGFAYLQVQNGL